MQVLVVDSHADSRELLIILLEQYGVETLTAACVEEAVDIMQQASPNLVISELVFPGEDGYSLISQVQAFEMVRGVRIPAIALTVCAQERDRTRALAAGFCGYLSKPFNIAALVQTAACALEQAEARL
ncbi:MAG TPA: response regulator [Trichocoleus sp.]